MGIQDRDYWKERYDVLHGRRPRTPRLRWAPRRRPPDPWRRWRLAALALGGAIALSGLWRILA